MTLRVQMPLGPKLLTRKYDADFSTATPMALVSRIVVW